VGGLTVTENSCVFCSIIEGSAEASFVYQDDWLVAFADRQPVTTGHLLVVPRKHVVGLADLDEDTGSRMWRLAQRLSLALRRSELPCAGVNFFLADGETAGQEVFHIHLHVFPRFDNDGFRLSAEWRIRRRSELDAAAKSVRSVL
jgi:histidine triad (HIT) family protein